MSASLVGSEMCIRDRALPLACRMWRFQVCIWLARAHVDVLSGRMPLSVSYTHLTLPTICSV
eukprot:14650808-Alexandrium_andersonii.AAC.1